jgi:hypothetical protein
MKKLILIYLMATVSGWATTRVTMIRNEKVVVYDEIVHQAETESGSDGLRQGMPNITVFLNEGTMRLTSDGGKAETRTVKRGEVIFRGPHDGKISAVSSSEIHFVRIELIGPGLDETWGMSGLPLDDRILKEDKFARTYEIRIPTGAKEPQHSQHGRVLVVLSGAELRLTLPDGSLKDTQLKTGSCVWRPAQTHAGENVGKSDYWAIAVEPK